MKKLWLILLILIIWYVLLIFQAPEITDKLGNKEINDRIRWSKATVDEISTNTPTKEEVIQFKDDVVNGIETTKEKIDTVRATLNNAEQKIKDTKEQIDNAVETVNNLKEDVGSALETVEKITDVLGETEEDTTE